MNLTESGVDSVTETSITIGCSITTGFKIELCSAFESGSIRHDSESKQLSITIGLLAFISFDISLSLSTHFNALLSLIVFDTSLVHLNFLED